MEFRDKKVSVIFENPAGEMLLQKRDEEPEINSWVPFGGSAEGDESDEDAARREILEELNYHLGEITLFKKYIHGDVEQIIYVAKDKVDLKDLELHEGSDMRFFTVAELDGLDIGFNYREIIEDYINNRKTWNMK